MSVNVYTYIIYTPNLGLGIAVFDQEREQSRFRGSIEGAGGSSEGARESIEEAGSGFQLSRGREFLGEGRNLTSAILTLAEDIAYAEFDLG